jgi:hypothetical protein
MIQFFRQHRQQAPVEYRLREPGAGWPGVSVEEFVFQRRKEAFGDSVVERFSGQSWRGPEVVDLCCESCQGSWL